MAKITRINDGVVIQAEVPDEQLALLLANDTAVAQMFQQFQTDQQKTLGLSSGGWVELIVKDPRSGNVSRSVAKSVDELKNLIDGCKLSTPPVPILYIGPLGSYSG